MVSPWASYHFTIFISVCLVYAEGFLFVCFWLCHHIQKILGQRSNLSHSSDNAASLTAAPPENFHRGL